MKESSFMMYRSFFDTARDIRDTYGKEEAEKFLLEIMYYGIHGERKEIFSDYVEASLLSIFPFINQAKAKKERVIQEQEVAREISLARRRNSCSTTSYKKGQ